MWEYDEKHAHLYEDVDIAEPDSLFDEYRNRSQAIKRAKQKIGMEETVFLHGTQGDQFDTVRQKIAHLAPKERKKLSYQYFIKAYLRCVASIDENIGRVLSYLDESGLKDNTIVIYTSDQGFFLGEHGLFDKRFMYEGSLRMPLIVRYPKEIRPGSVSDDIVLNVDFAETFLHYAGAPIPEDMQGRSLRPLFKGNTPEDWRSSMYYRYWMHGAHFNVAAHFGVRTKRYKLIYYYGLPLNAKGAKKKPTPPEWELFDLQKDPSEMNNVYSDPAYRAVVKELKTELIRLRRELEDDNDGVVVDLEVICD
jgi:arylsulfatase A-like enzyme